MKRYVSYLLLVQSMMVSPACTPRKQHKTVPIAIELSSDDYTDDQREILRLFGSPDEAYQCPLGVTRWIYCDGRSKPLLFEFDANGKILTSAVGGEAVCKQ